MNKVPVPPHCAAVSLSLNDFPAQVARRQEFKDIAAMVHYLLVVPTGTFSMGPDTLLLWVTELGLPLTHFLMRTQVGPH